MPMDLRVEAVDGRPVVTKEGSGAVGARVRAEADRLRAAAHPGVVDVVDHGPTEGGWRLRTIHGGRPLDTVGLLPVEQAAAIVASAAETVADLHDLGIVHGRITAGHVLLGANGRPQLCGFGPGPAATDPPATRADDVAALGRVLAGLIGSDGEVEPIPDRRWGRRRRWAGVQRRALLNLADQATAEMATHRPTARRLAGTIVEAVPTARLAPAPPPTPGPPAAPTPLDRLRADSPGATTTGPSTPEPAPTPPAAATAATSMPRPAVAASTGPGVGDPGRPTGTAAPRHAAAAPRRRQQQRLPAALALVGVALLAVGMARTTGQPGRAPASPAASAPATSPSSSPPPAATPPTTDRPTTDPPTTGPGRTDPPTTGPGRTDPPTTGPGRTGPRTTAAVPGPASGQPPAPTRCVPVDVPGPDLDGDGCPDPVTVDGAVLQVGDRRFAVADPGDVVVLGDWTCDGTVTPAALRPSTGEVFAFPSWPGPGDEVVVDATDRVPGAVGLAVEHLGGGCHGLTAEVPGQGRVRIVVQAR